MILQALALLSLVIGFWFPIFFFIAIIFFALSDDFRREQTNKETIKTSKKRHFRSPTTTQLTNDNELFMYKFNKKEYLKSPEWSNKRKLVLTRDKNTCQSCGTNHNLSVHHIRYTNLYREPLDDLTTLCQDCHTHLHDVVGYPSTVLEYNLFEGPVSAIKDK